MYHAGPARAALMLFYLVAMLFGVLRLNAKRLLVLAFLALAAHGTCCTCSYLRDADGQCDLDSALAEFAVLMVVLPWFAVMGGYVNRLRAAAVRQPTASCSAAFERIGELAIRDELTGVYNRRFLMEALAREQLARRAPGRRRSRSA